MHLEMESTWNENTIAMKHFPLDTYNLDYYLNEQFNDVKLKVVFRLYRIPNIVKSTGNCYQTTQNKILHQILHEFQI